MNDDHLRRQRTSAVRTGEPGPSPRVGGSLERIPALDGLRGIAVILVMAHHLSVMASSPTHTLVPGGYLGVDVFFVLSGFLITSMLLEEHRAKGRIGFGAFYGRRAARLLPAMFVLLTVHASYALLAGHDMGTEFLSVRAAVFYVSNWTWVWDGLRSASGLGHLWSLAVEEQFYLAWPLVVAAGLAATRRVGLHVAGLLAMVGVVAFHRVRLLDLGDSMLFLYQRTDTRADSLLIGAALGCLWMHALIPRRVAMAASILGVVTLGAFVCTVEWFEPSLYRWGFTVVAVSAAAVVLGVASASGPVATILTAPLLRRTGQISYGLYLWHLPIFTAVAQHGARWPEAARFTVGVIVSVAAAAASWRLVEAPAQQWWRQRSVRRTIAVPPIVAVVDPAPHGTEVLSGSTDGRVGHVDRADPVLQHQVTTLVEGQGGFTLHQLADPRPDEVGPPPVAQP